jgi:hypothetical protein
MYESVHNYPNPLLCKTGSNNSTDDLDPTYSPDGETIAYTGDVIADISVP